MTSPGIQTRISQRFAAWAVMLLSLPLAANGSGQTKNKGSQAPVYQDGEGYEVLSILLNRLSVARKNDTVRIDPRTASGKRVAEIKVQCSGIPLEFQRASQDFDTKTKSRLILRRGFSLTKNYQLANGSALTYYVAAVGFDDKRTRAVAFVEYICGNLCGDSIFYFLRKSEKGWVEAPEVQREVQSCGRIY